MNRVRIVATTEFLAIVRTRAFLIGLLMAPALIALSIGLQLFAARNGDVGDHRFAVVDRTGELFDVIAAAAAQHNAEAGSGSTRRGPHFLPERAEPDPSSTSATAVALSERVRTKDLFAFVDIPATVLDTARTDPDQISYYTETPLYGSLPDWLHTTLEREITARRFRTSSLDPKAVERLTRPAAITTLGLFERRADGSIAPARRVNPAQTIILPFVMMYLLFLSLTTAAPQLLTAVIEEKMSRISEVLISSISPGQLMAGKMVGVAVVAVSLALVYLAGGLYFAMTTGSWDLIRPALIGWFLVYLLSAVLIFGSIFVAIGSACSDLKDSQAMMQPVMMFLVMPLIASPIVLRSPESTASVVLSLIPTATPFLMVLRLALTPPPPMWQIALSVVLSVCTVVLFIWAAGRIFRVGLLMQGKPPNLPELLRWIRQ